MYQLRYNASTNHIDGLDIRTTSSGDSLDYSQNHCAALTRGGHKMARGKTADDAAEILSAARASTAATGRKLCSHCEHAAEAMITAHRAA